MINFSFAYIDKLRTNDTRGRWLLNIFGTDVRDFWIGNNLPEAREMLEWLYPVFRDCYFTAYSTCKSTGGRWLESRLTHELQTLHRPDVFVRSV